MENITLTKQALSRLLSAFYPNPEDPYPPHGPIGPHVHDRFVSVFLNPQPLPPVAGPSPEPWRAAFLGRSVIDRAVLQFQFLEAEGRENITAVASYVTAFVDDYCGNGRPRWPLPWPWPPSLDFGQLHPVDHLVTASQFQAAADAMQGSPLQAVFSRAADQCFETGLRRLQAGVHAPRTAQAA